MASQPAPEPLVSVVVRALAGPSGPVRVRGGLVPLVGPLSTVVGDADGDASLIGHLPPGAALGEAMAARARLLGHEVVRAEPLTMATRELLDNARERGRSSVEIIRAEPQLVTVLQVGAWFQARWGARLVRRALVALPRPLLRGLPTAVAADVAFWSGVRDRATPDEWHRLTRSSYVALCYHRAAGDGREGDERIDLPPRQFQRQLRLLRLLRCHRLDLDEVVAFHGSADRRLPARSVLITADDGFDDLVTQLALDDPRGAVLFVLTGDVGGQAWPGSAPLAGWTQLRELEARGARVQSHGRHHRSLPELSDVELDEELVRARTDLLRYLARPPQAVAYPHGRHDERVLAAARQAGYGVGFTTLPGRNGAGTDAFCLRRITPKAWDSRLSFAVKVLTGEPLPASWERWLVRRHSLRAIAERLAADAGPARLHRVARVAALLDRELSDRTAPRVLDAGCQDGELARLLAGRHPDWFVVAADLDAEALARGRSSGRQSDVGSRVREVCADLTQPLSPGRFDAVMAVECLAEIPDDDAVLRNLAGALKPSGRIYLHVPRAGWRPVLPGSPRNWYGNVRDGYDPGQLVRRLQAHGLVVDRVEESMRAPLQLAEELRYRWVRHRSLRRRLLMAPLFALARGLETMRMPLGSSRALLVVGHKA